MKHLKNLLKGKGMLAFLLFTFCLSMGYAQNSTSSEVKKDFCHTDELLNKSLEEDSELQQKLDDQNSALRNYINNFISTQAPAAQSAGGGSGSANYVIPTVIYVVHNNGVENITDTQVHSQIDKLNSEFSAHGISFCLATEENGTSLPGTGPDPGIVRIQSSLTNHLTSAEGTLKALSPLPADRYLRIWVVKDINNGSGIVGYARFPGTVAPALEGIVMRYDVFGDVATCGCTNLIPSNDQGKVLAHEVGHYLNLYHTFQGGCAGTTAGTCDTQGDLICDTPPVAVANTGCPGSPVNSCTETPTDNNDLLDNHMDYTNDNCRNNFTPGQETRMICAINMFRSTLVSSQNLVYTGVQCNGGILAAFSADNYTPCNGDLVTFTANVQTGVTYTWDFGDGSTPVTGNPVTHSYATGGTNYSVTLTVTDGTNTVSEVQDLFVTDCSPISSSQGNWYFYERAGLDFSGGTPTPDDAAWVNNTITAIGTGQAGEACISQSNSSGDLLFYSNGTEIWNENHSLINSGNPLFGNISAANGMISVPDPGNPNRYYIFTVGASGTYSKGLRYSRVQISGTAASTTGTWNVPITTPSGFQTGDNSALIGGEGITAVAACDGYWILATGRKSSDRYLLVYKVNSSGVTYHSQFQTSSGNIYHRLKASPDGSKLVITQFSFTGTYMYDFDKHNGTVSNEQLINNNSQYGATFSPNSQLLYAADAGGSLYQYDVTAATPSSTEVLVAATNLRSLQIAPDGKVYGTRSGQTRLAVIHQPDNLCTALDPNACNYTILGPELNTMASGTDIRGKWGLPNMVDANTAEVFDNSISCDITNCFTYTFTADYCGNTFIWDFGDMTGGMGGTVTHTYPSAGTYTVTLTIDGTTTVTKTITVGISSSIAGPTTVCLNDANVFNYSASTTGSGLTYNWSATGGTIGLNGNDNVDVTWTSLPGTLTLTVTDPATGCTSTSTINVIEDCSGGCDITPNFYPAISAKDHCVHLFSDGTIVGDGCTITSWFWDFGDGSTSTLQNPAHAFPTNGVYLVCLTVTAICNGEVCTETICYKIPVEFCDPCEDLQPKYYVAVGIDGCTMYFNDATSVPAGCVITSWFWDFGDGSTSTLQNPVHSFPGNGNYNVCLTVTMQCGKKICKETFCSYIPVEYCEKRCEVEPDFYQAVSIKNPCTFLFTDGTSIGSNCSIVSWHWDFGDGTTSSLQNPTHTFAASGIYNVCLTVTANCNGQICIEKICYPAWVLGCDQKCDIKPDYYIAIDPDRCTFYFSDNTTLGSGCTITGWTWDFGDGNSSNAQNPTHTYSANGSYTVCLTVTANCNGKICTETICYDVMVNGCNPCPCGLGANFSFSTSDCKVQFQNLSLTNGCTQITGYSWDFGDGATSSAANPSHTYAGSGTYAVCLTIYGNNGYKKCQETICYEVEVDCDPCVCEIFPKFNYKEANCVVKFNDLTTTNSCTSILSWNWDFGDGNTSTAQNPTHVYSSPGVYVVCLTVEGFDGKEKCEKTYCFEVVTECEPCECEVKADFAYNVKGCTVGFYDLSKGNMCSSLIGWYWDFGDGNTSGSANPTHTYSSPGSYYVCLVTYASNGKGICKDRVCYRVDVEDCKESSDRKRDGEGVDPTSDLGVSLYPNPFNDQLNIDIELDKEQEVSINVFDSYGKHIAEITKGSMNAGSHSIVWQPQDANLASGMYIVAIKTADGFDYKKVTFNK